MSRHRNVRAIDVDEEYDGYYSCYGHSVEDDFCISPRTEAQFLYDRNAKKQNMAAFFSTPELPEEENSGDESNDSINGSFTEMSRIDAAKLHSCIEALQNVVGDTISESVLRNAATAFEYNVEHALNAVLSGNVPKPQRIRNCKKGDSVASSSLSNVPMQINDSASSIDNLITSKPTLICTNDNPNILNEDSMSENSQEKLIKNELSTDSSDLQPMQNDSSSVLTNQELLNLSEKSSNIETAISTKSLKSQKDAMKIYEKERGDGKPLINLVVIGHVDAGKSTLMGHLLFRLGEISKRTMHKFEQDSKKLGKSSFMYAWVLDETPEERNRGITMDVAQSKFETKNKAVTLLDAPGHKDFIPNMITGAAEADVAILVVDSTRGEFETGFEAGGQTREHTMLIRSLGVTQVAVAVNKMDNVQWLQERYNEIVSKLSAFLKQAGFKESDVTFVPCSGLTGVNLMAPPEEPELKKWYIGPTLVDVIDNFRPPERLICKPLRMCISDVFKGLTGGFCVSGKIEAGCAKTGERILVMPSAEQATIKAITVNEISQQHGFAGDHVIMQLAGIDVNNVTCGSMVCELNSAVKVTTRFQARLVIFNITIPITKGFPVIIHYQSVSEQATIKKLISQLHRSTGEVVKKNPRCLTKNSSAVVEIETAIPICLELYKDLKELGRFMLRSSGSTIAAGLVTQIL